VLWRELQATRYFPVITDSEAEEINLLIDSLPEISGATYPDDLVVIVPGPSEKTAASQTLKIEVDPKHLDELRQMLDEVLKAIASEPPSVRDPGVIRPYGVRDGLSDLAGSVDFWRWAGHESATKRDQPDAVGTSKLVEMHEIRTALVMVLKRMIFAGG